jgi:hypothetical protein
MNARTRKHIDPLDQAIEKALAPGSFISYKASWSFVDAVQGVANDVGRLIATEPERAVRLYETFIAACHEKADEIDDSSGDFGTLVEELFRGWMRARQAAGEDRGETAKSLLAWMEDDPYGFCYHLDREAAGVTRSPTGFVQSLKRPQSPSKLKRSVYRVMPAAGGERYSRPFLPRRGILMPTSSSARKPRSGPTSARLSPTCTGAKDVSMTPSPGLSAGCSSRCQLPGGHSPITSLPR